MKLAGKTDVGRVRQENQDDYRAGELPGDAAWVLVCDGMGGARGGREASQSACNVIERCFQEQYAQCMPGEEEAFLKRALISANRFIFQKAMHEEAFAGMGTTVTAVALVAGYWVIAHIGDSRAYLLRDGRLSRITCDHSYVQHLINTGRITPSEAKNHPQRNVVMRVLGDFDIDPRPDISVRRAHPADRWLLCSDGLCGVLEDSTIEETMTTLSDQGECAQRLVQMALRAGSTDNVTAVIADATLALDADAFDLPHQTPLVGGAASRNLEPIADIVNEPVATAPALREDDSPAQRAAALIQPASAHEAETTQTTAKPSSTRVVQPSTVREETGERANPDTGEIPVVQKPDGRLSADPNDPDVAKAIRDEQVEQKKATRTKKRRNKLAVIITCILAVLALAGAGWGAYTWSQTHYYVGDSNGTVAIYRGVPTNLFGLELSHEVQTTNIATADLPQTWRDQLSQGITVGSLDEAQSHVGIIRTEMRKLAKQQEADAAKKAEASNSPDSSKDSSQSDSKDGTKDSSSQSGSSSDKSGSSSSSDSSDKSGIGAADNAATGDSQ